MLRLSNIVLAASCLLLSACSTTKQLIQSMQQKTTTADGFVAISKITVTDPATNNFLPTLKTIIVSGKLVSIAKDATFLDYSRNSSSSIWNAKSITTTERLVISLRNGQKMADVLQKISKCIQQDSAHKQQTTQLQVTAQTK